MVTEIAFRRIVKASAWYDLFVTCWFITPWTFDFVLVLTEHSAQMMGMGGNFPPFEPSHVLFANLLGSVVVVWALVRIATPEPRLGRYDAAARSLFAVWQITAVLNGAPSVILAFTIFEILFGVMQMLPIRHPAVGGGGTVALAANE